jgi:NTP pyrophosphatase (non-canonical NTP hydrolase)
MHFNDYQKRAHTTAVYPIQGYQMLPFYPIMGLVGETGELANNVKKIYRDGDGTLKPEFINKLQYELGDILWYVAEIASQAGLDLNDIANRNLEKLADRARRNKIKGEGDKR